MFRRDYGAHLKGVGRRDCDTNLAAGHGESTDRQVTGFSLPIETHGSLKATRFYSIYMKRNRARMPFYHDELQEWGADESLASRTSPY
jgi:hypothetical protein